MNLLKRDEHGVRHVEYLMLGMAYPLMVAVLAIFWPETVKL